MAIAYKSAGSGVSTETSGAALSPLTPATVDANDILIAHVFWEGTATAPSTPSGWDLLSGPHVIQSTIARHWVFGRLALASDDGVAAAFGAPAVTTQRAARIYSFSGWTSGTIVQAVVGFTHQSHATDPQMPTVVTTEAGNLACALVAQNDNNAFANATGESGGDWTEVVAEYTVALTPGLSLGLQTCTPTSNPGTVSGGSIATTNDPCGVIGFQIKAATVNTTVTPGVLALVDTQLTPTVTAHALVTPGVLALVDTQLTPTVTAHALVTPGVLALVDTQYEPTVTVQSAGTTVTPGTLALADTQFAPQANLGVIPGTLALNEATFAPTVTATANVTATPGVLALADTHFAPTVTTPRTVTPGVLAATATPLAPTILTPHVSIVGTYAMVVGAFAPVVTTPQTVTPGTRVLAATRYAPTALTPVLVVPGTYGLTLTLYRGGPDPANLPVVAVLALRPTRNGFSSDWRRQGGWSGFV